MIYKWISLMPRIWKKLEPKFFHLKIILFFLISYSSGNFWNEILQVKNLNYDINNLLGDKKMNHFSAKVVKSGVIQTC